MQSRNSRTSPRSVAGLRGPLSALAVLGLALAACQPRAPGVDGAAAVDTAAVVASVDSLRSAYQRAVADGDWQRLAGMVTEDARLVSPGSEAWDAALAAASEAGTPFPPGSTLEITSAEAGVLGPDWAYDMGTGVLTWTPEGADEPRTARDTYLVLLHRTSEGWKVHREVASSRPLPGGGE